MVQGQRRENLAAAVRAGNYEIISGVTEKLGGNDEGPDPHQLLEAALAACTIITIQMYANRKQWKLQSADVKVSIVSEVKGHTRILREVSLVGELSDEERARLFDIANKCPIHHVLVGNVEIETLQV